MGAKCCVTWDFAVKVATVCFVILVTYHPVLWASWYFLWFFFFSHLFQCFSEWAFFVIPVFNFHWHRSGHDCLPDSHLLKVTMYWQTSKLHTLVIKRNPALYQDAWPTTYKTLSLSSYKPELEPWLSSGQWDPCPQKCYFLEISTETHSFSVVFCAGWNMCYMAGETGTRNLDHKRTVEVGTLLSKR